MAASFKVWAVIVAFVAFTTLGDVWLAKAMTGLGDLGKMRRERGTLHVVLTVCKSWLFWLAIAGMAGSFFSLLAALNWADLSLVGPASSAMVFITSTLAAKFYLKEQVDARRWIATLLVCLGIFLISQ